MPTPTLSTAGKWIWEVSVKVSVVVIVGLLFSSPVWVSRVYSAVTSIGENTKEISANSKLIAELAITLGGMGQLFGNAEVLDVGDTMTASYNTHSDAVRFKPGQRLIVTNTGDRREMSVTLVIEGKFESEPHIFLNLSKNAGRALGATPGDMVQIAIEPVEEK